MPPPPVPVAASEGPRFANFGETWGQAAARCISVDSDVFGEEDALRLQPIPGCFLCPISQEVMTDPVATVDGAIYERSYIEAWFREKVQQGASVTSPSTGLELQSRLLLPLIALQKAIEAYIHHRPELRALRESARSHEEALRLLQGDLVAKSQTQARLKQQQRKAVDAQAAKVRTARERHGMVQAQNSKLRKALRGLLSKMQGLRSKCSALAKSLEEREAELKLARIHLQRARLGQECHSFADSCMLNVMQLVSQRSSGCPSPFLEDLQQPIYIASGSSPGSSPCSPKRAKIEVLDRTPGSG